MNILCLLFGHKGKVIQKGMLEYKDLRLPGLQLKCRRCKEIYYEIDFSVLEK